MGACSFCPYQRSGGSSKNVRVHGDAKKCIFNDGKCVNGEIPCFADRAGRSCVGSNFLEPLPKELMQEHND